MRYHLNTILVFATCLSLLSQATVTLAQNKPGKKIQRDQEPKPGDTVQVETMAVLPWHFEQGTTGAQKTAKEFLSTLLVKTRVEAVSEVRAVAAWEDANKEPWKENRTELPSPAQMLRVGNKLGVDWVMAGRAKWQMPLQRILLM